MMQPDKLNRRHLAGAFGLALVAAGLGFVASRNFERRVEVLSEDGGARSLQQNPARPLVWKPPQEIAKP